MWGCSEMREGIMLEELYEIQNEILRKPLPQYKRPLFGKIAWQERLLGVVGFRGVGKTTLLLQYKQEHFKNTEDCLYVSADNIRVSHVGLYEIAREFFHLGGQVLLIDEVHKYKNWAQEIKNIYDTFTTGKVIISGSSLIDILQGKTDLSRRLVSYELPGLSFREYLNLTCGKNFDPTSLADLLEKHVDQTRKISKQFRVLKYFQKFLQNGYYPFHLEGENTYQEKLQNIIEKVLYEDIPSVHNLKPDSVVQLKKIINLIATSQPFTPNIEKMSSQLNLSKEYVYHYIDYLERAKLLSSLAHPSKGYQLVRKPAKLYLENPNLIFHIVGRQGFKAEPGTIRESFFLNQVRVSHQVSAAEQGDFRVDDKYVFEIGGRRKTKEQIASVKNAHVVSDDIEQGSRTQIPLWYFGFLY